MALILVVSADGLTSTFMRNRPSRAFVPTSISIIFSDVWELERFDYLWPTKNEGVLFKNHTLAEYGNEVKDTPVKYSVFVQVLNKSPEEASKCCSIIANP